MSILHATPAAVQFDATPADDWSARFDAAQARFRESLRKPAVLVIDPDPLPMVASPIDGIGDMQDANFYRTFAWSPELAARRLAVVKASVDRINAEIDAQEDAEAVPYDDPAWDADPAFWEPTEPESFSDELLSAVTFHPLDGPVARRADGYDLARAHEAGFQLGSDGFTARDVAPPSHMTAAECDEFMAGLDAGEARLWADFARDMEAMADREATMDALYGFPLAEVNEAELCAAGCLVGHDA